MSRRIFRHGARREKALRIIAELDEWIGQMRSAVDNIGKGPYSPLMLGLAQQAIDANDLRHA